MCPLPRGNPTLYSLFETREKIESFGAPTTLSRQRYLAAWDFSAQLCSLEHPGKPPCFFPSDFCLTFGRRSAESISTLVGSCPSLVFYVEYHTNSASEPLSAENDNEYHKEENEDEKGVSVDLSRSDPAKLHSSAPKREHPVLKTTRVLPEPESQSSTLESGRKFTVSMQNRDTSQCDAVDPKVPAKKSLRGAIWTGLLGKPEKSTEEANEVDEAKVDEQAHEIKGTFFHFGAIRRTILRKCLGRSSSLLMNASLWANAEDSFVNRLTREIRDLERLIQDFLEIL